MRNDTHNLRSALRNRWLGTGTGRRDRSRWLGYRYGGRRQRDRVYAIMKMHRRNFYVRKKNKIISVSQKMNIVIQSSCCSFFSPQAFFFERDAIYPTWKESIRGERGLDSGTRMSWNWHSARFRRRKTFPDKLTSLIRMIESMKLVDCSESY